jgi:succinate dehydrogenase hydrophobic anchor subunit
MKLSTFFLLWVFGFFLLLSFDLFIEAFVFEWLSWNGTDKNDWFFALWWGLVVVWALHGCIKLRSIWNTTDQD